MGHYSKTMFLFLSLEVLHNLSGLISDHFNQFQTDPDGGLCLITFYITYLSIAWPFPGLRKHSTSEG